MASGLPNSVIDAILDKLGGPGLDTTLLPATLYFDLHVIDPDDDSGTGAVSWDQGRTAVDMTDPAVWADADGRAKLSAAITSATNTSGDTITVTSFGWYTAATAGTYKGGSPLAGDTVDIEDGGSYTAFVTLASPSPDDTE